MVFVITTDGVQRDLTTFEDRKQWCVPSQLEKIAILCLSGPEKDTASMFLGNPRLAYKDELYLYGDIARTVLMNL